MKCPGCDYKHGHNWEVIDEATGEEDLVKTIGEVGDFCQHPVKMERPDRYHDHNNQQTRLYACPACGIAFIDA